MIERMLGAARLDVNVFEDVESDMGLTGQAMLVVIIVAIASGIGTLGGDREIGGLVLGIIGALIRWAVWAFLTYLVGTTIFNTPQTYANWGQLARTTGFAQSPGVLHVFGFIPVIGWVITVVVSIWQLVAMVVGVRQAMDYDSTLRAVGVVLVSAIPAFLLFILFI